MEKNKIVYVCMCVFLNIEYNNLDESQRNEHIAQTLNQSKRTRALNKKLSW